MIIATFPVKQTNGVSPGNEREAQSIAFFKTPLIPLL